MAKAKDSKKSEELEMTDERRMRASGAEESGYHAPSAQDIEDIKKDHHTHSEPNAVNADAFIRDESQSDEPSAEKDEALNTRANADGKAKIPQVTGSVPASGPDGDFRPNAPTDGSLNENDGEEKILGRRTA